MISESQGEADWPWSSELFLDEFHSDTRIGNIAAPPVIYADHDLMNAYCTGAVAGYRDYLFSLLDMDGNVKSDHIMLQPFLAAKGLTPTPCKDQDDQPLSSDGEELEPA
jgi:hypothetical protein